VELDPQAILQRLKAAIPTRFHRDLVVVGSLAAACHFAEKLAGNPINTKDADVLVEPTGSVRACQRMAEGLLQRGWEHRREKGFDPQPSRRSKEKKPYIKLKLPGERDFFVEFLGIPRKDEQATKREVDLKLPDGWYSMPVFRFMRLATVSPRTSTSGLKVAAPWMMALANLLSHPTIGTKTMSYDHRLRASKDLGRVLAIAQLSERSDLEQWPALWLAALKACFPKSWRRLAPGVGRGLVELFKNGTAVGDAVATVGGLGLMRGYRVTRESLEAAAEQLQLLAIEPFRELARGR
jgi:hypothetical protein